MTRSSLRLLIRKLLTEQDVRYFDPDLVNELLTDAEREFAEETKCLNYYIEASSVANQMEYGPFQYTNAITAVWWRPGTTSVVKLEPRTEAEIMASYGQTYRQLTGTPAVYFMREDRIGLVPAPAAAALTIRAYIDRQPTPITDDTTEPMIPENYHMALAYHVAWTLAGSDANVRIAHYYHRWESAIDRAKMRLKHRQVERLPTMKAPI